MLHEVATPLSLFPYSNYAHYFFDLILDIYNRLLNSFIKVTLSQKSTTKFPTFSIYSYRQEIVSGGIFVIAQEKVLFLIYKENKRQFFNN